MRRTVRCFAHLARRASHASRSANFVEEQPFALWALSRQRSNAAASADGVKEPSKTTASSSHRDGSGGAAQAREGSRPPQKGRDRNAGYASSGGVDKRTADFHGLSAELLDYAAWRLGAHKKEDGGGGRSPVELTRERREALTVALRRMPASGWVAENADKQGISPRLFPTVLSSFRQLLLARTGASPSQGDGVAEGASTSPQLEAEEIEQLARKMLPLFVQYATVNFPSEVHAALSLRTALSFTDAFMAGTAYPKARAMKRKLVYHAGPTNSGKTHTALQRLQGAKSGVYCGPLRLLAMEVYDSCNGNGTYCSLVTGQERREVPFARHVSCTVEMANIDEPVDVGVIDEIQLMADEDRGWAWTRAFFGIPAKELHLCGDVSCLPLVRRFAEALGEELEECHYDRFTPLVVEGRSLEGSFEAILPGDAVIAFSKKSIFNIRAAIESSSGHRCCVIYGALPPETRRRQANLFNDPNSGYDVLVASDAVGLGLNLNIRRVVFTSLSRPDGPGQPLMALTASMVKQIAGRAGRRGSRWGTEGSVTTLMPTDLYQVQAYLSAPMPPAAAVGVMPGPEHIEAFSKHFPGLPLPDLLENFSESAAVSGPFFLCQQGDLVKAARELEAVAGLPLDVRLQFATAPVSWQSSVCSSALIRYAQAFSHGGDVPVEITLPPKLPAGGRREEVLSRLSELEETHQALSIYLWLAQRMGRESFSQCDRAEELMQQVISELDAGLNAMDASAHASSTDEEAAALREKLARRALGISGQTARTKSRQA